MRVFKAGALARMALAMALAFSVVTASVPLDLTPVAHAPESGVAQAQGKQQERQARKGAKERKTKKHKSKAGKNKGKHKNKSKKKKRHQNVPAALDAEQIAIENAPAVEAFDCEGLDKIELDGRTFCTHGDDPRMFGRAAATAREAGSQSAPRVDSAQRPLCIDDGVSGPRVQIVYVHANNRPNRLGEFLPTFRRLASEMDTIVDQSARKTGGSLRLRFVTNAQCQVEIPALAVPASALGSLSDVMNQLKNAGYNAENRKYLILADATNFCGIATFVSVQKEKDADRAATTVHDFRGYARVDLPCWDAGTMIHELGHTMGAVQFSAPHANGGAHCIDEWDVMCYKEGSTSPSMRILCPDGAQDFRLDCNNDDYFAANPAPGSYLDTHWNMARSIYFIEGSGEVCLDAALEPDDAYWYGYWDVPMRKFAVGGSEARAFCDEPGDTDWILFEGERGKAYQIQTTDLGPEVDTQLVVYRGFEEQGWIGMTRIGANDNRADGDPSSSITFAAPGPGTYLVGVSEAGNRAGFDKTYTISVQETSPTATSALALSRGKVGPNRKFTATMSGVTPSSEVTFWLHRGKKSRELGRVTADADGVASALLRVPKGARKGVATVEATASDLSTASAQLKVKKKGGKDNKGGKKWKKSAQRGKSKGRKRKQ